MTVSASGWLIVGLCVYFGFNLVCALVLHRHADRQAHLPVRFLDVLVHFLLMTAFAIPVLLVVLMEALFGGREAEKKPSKLPKATEVSQLRPAA